MKNEAVKYTTYVNYLLILLDRSSQYNVTEKAGKLLLQILRLFAAQLNRGIQRLPLVPQAFKGHLQFVS